MTWFQPRSSRTAWRSLSASIAFLALAGLASETRADGPPLGNGSFSADDETVGTLPSTGSDTGLDLVRNATARRTSVSLEGRFADLQNALLSVRGQATAAIETVVPGTDVVRVTLLGDVQVVLDKMYVDSGDVRIALVVPKELAAKPGQLFIGRQALARFPLLPGSNALPSASAAPVRFVSSTGAAAMLAEVRTAGDVVIVTQAHPR